MVQLSQDGLHYANVQHSADLHDRVAVFISFSES
jgi:hypothetical protein